MPEAPRRTFSFRRFAYAFLGVAVATLVLGAALWVQSAATKDETKGSAGDASRSLRTDAASMERRLLETTRYLASDRLEGRGVGTQGIELAAQFIADEFQRAGLNTNHYEGTAFQRFGRSRRVALTGVNEVSVTGLDGATHHWDLSRDFTPLSISASGTFSLPLVFVGYGITAPEHGYDDYQGVDVQGKAVIILRREPQQRHRESPFDGVLPTRYARLGYKVANAVEHKAAAVVFCTERDTLSRRAGARIQGRDDLEVDFKPHDRLIGFQVRAPELRPVIPVLHARRHLLNEIVESVSGSDLSGREVRIDDTLQPQSCELSPYVLLGQVTVGRTAHSLKNVIATLEGEGETADETIVIGAHYDHLGFGGSGSLDGARRQIHNGADDNASGVAITMEVARLLAARKEPLPRRVLFVGFTAEEIGLVGSEYYVQHPLVPLEDTVAMFNLDMVGYLRQDLLEIYGVGTAIEFEPLLYKLGHVHGFRLVGRQGGYSPSDHASFLPFRIPVLHFFTGFHDHYHRASDDVEKLNIRGMRRITQLLCDLTVEIATSHNRPRVQVAEESDLLAGVSPSRFIETTPLSLGVDGRISGDGGFLVQRVRKRGLAARSGLRAGDRLLEVNALRLSNDGDLQKAEDALQRGTQVPVVLRRGRVELEILMQAE